MTGERLTAEAIDIGRLLGEVAAPSRGAIVIFLGTARDHERGGAPGSVTGLEYVAYAPMARQVLCGIESDLEAEHAGLRLRIIHRLGKVPIGETSVAIAAAAPHREAAYSASRTALERLKKETPIWKRERYADGNQAWREEEPLRSAPSTRAAHRSE